MAGDKRKVQEINAGSMADIAFLLLIFFLVATTMNVDTGIARNLPPMPPEDQKVEDMKVKIRNLLPVLVNGRGDIFELHDSIDTVERELKSTLGCDATIHMDPVETDNEQVNAERAALEEALKDVDGLRGIHDFRMVMGPSHTNLIFDVVMDTGCGKTPEQFRDIICRTVEEKLPGHFAVVTVDTSFVF